MTKPISWTDELKAEVESLYKAKMGELAEANPDAEEGTFSNEALTYAAAEIGTSVASARAQLTKLGVYVKQINKAKKTSNASEGGTKRVGKAEAQGELIAAFKDGGVTDLDDDIISKLTGKAASHLAAKIRELQSQA